MESYSSRYNDVISGQTEIDEVPEHNAIVLLFIQQISSLYWMLPIQFLNISKQFLSAFYKKTLSIENSSYAPINHKDAAY